MKPNNRESAYVVSRVVDFSNISLSSGGGGSDNKYGIKTPASDKKQPSKKSKSFRTLYFPITNATLDGNRTRSLSEWAYHNFQIKNACLEFTFPDWDSFTKEEKERIIKNMEKSYIVISDIGDSSKEGVYKLELFLLGGSPSSKDYRIYTSYAEINLTKENAVLYAIPKLGRLAPIPITVKCLVEDDVLLDSSYKPILSKADSSYDNTSAGFLQSYSLPDVVFKDFFTYILNRSYSLVFANSQDLSRFFPNHGKAPSEDKELSQIITAVYYLVPNNRYPYYKKASSFSISGTFLTIPEIDYYDNIILVVDPKKAGLKPITGYLQSSLSGSVTSSILTPFGLDFGTDSPFKINGNSYTDFLYVDTPFIGNYGVQPKIDGVVSQVWSIKSLHYPYIAYVNSTLTNIENPNPFVYVSSSPSGFDTQSGIKVAVWVADPPWTKLPIKGSIYYTESFATFEEVEGFAYSSSNFDTFYPIINQEYQTVEFDCTDPIINQEYQTIEFNCTEPIESQDYQTVEFNCTEPIESQEYQTLEFNCTEPIQNQGYQTVEFDCTDPIINQEYQTLEFNCTEPITKQEYQTIEFDCTDPIQNQGYQTVEFDCTEPIIKQIYRTVEYKFIEPIESQEYQTIEFDCKDPIESQDYHTIEFNCSEPIEQPDYHTEEYEFEDLIESQEYQTIEFECSSIIESQDYQTIEFDCTDPIINQEYQTVEFDCVEPIIYTSFKTIEFDCLEPIEQPNYHTVESKFIEPIESQDYHTIEFDCKDLIESQEYQTIEFDCTEPIEQPNYHTEEYEFEDLIEPQEYKTIEFNCIELITKQDYQTIEFDCTEPIIKQIYRTVEYKFIEPIESQDYHTVEFDAYQPIEGGEYNTEIFSVTSPITGGEYNTDPFVVNSPITGGEYNTDSFVVNSPIHGGEYNTDSFIVNSPIQGGGYDTDSFIVNSEFPIVLQDSGIIPPTSIPSGESFDTGLEYDSNKQYIITTNDGEGNTTYYGWEPEEGV